MGRKLVRGNVFKICGDEIHTRYSRAADEEQKKVLGSIAFLNYLKGIILKKEFGKLCSRKSQAN